MVLARVKKYNSLCNFDLVQDATCDTYCINTKIPVSDDQSLVFRDDDAKYAWMHSELFQAGSAAHSF